MLRGVVGRDVDMEDFRPVMIHDDQETWRSRIGMRCGLRRRSSGKSSLREEMAKLDHLGACKILGMRFSHDVAFAGDLEHKLAVGLFMGVANFRDQSDNIVSIRDYAPRDDGRSLRACDGESPLRIRGLWWRRWRRSSVWSVFIRLSLPVVSVCGWSEAAVSDLCRRYLDHKSNRLAAWRISSRRQLGVYIG